VAVAAQPTQEAPTSIPQETLDYLEVAYLLLFAAFLLTSWVSFTLAELGLDRPVVVLAFGVVGLVVGGAVVFRRRWKAVAPGALAGLALPVLIGAVLYFPPDEWVLGALDPGTYINAGAMIARTGSIVFHSSTLAAMDPAQRAVLFPDPHSLVADARLPGFYLSSLQFHGVVPVGFAASADRIVPHAFHFYPSVLAFGYAVGGISTELLVTPLLAVAGLAGFYLALRRLFGAKIAAVAAFFLSLGPAQVWFARYPDAEILVQLLLFAGFLAFVAMIDSPSRPLAVLAGLAFGAVHLAKIEMLPLPFLIAGFFAYQAAIQRFDRRWWWFIWAYVAFLVHAILHGVLIANFYAMAILEETVSLRLVVAVVAVVVVAALVSGILFISPAARWRVRIVLTDDFWETPVAVGLPLAIGILALYAYYIRPMGSSLTPAEQLDPVKLYVMNNVQSFLRLGWYVTPLGLLLGTLGWMFIAHQDRDRRTALPLLIIVVDTLLFLYDVKITPVHYWAARRWVPLVIPGFCLAAAYLLARLLPRERKQWFQAVVPLGCGLVMIAGLLGGTRPLLGYVEYRGATQQLGQLAATFPSDSVVLFADGDSGQRFSVTLDFLFGRTSLIISADPRMDAAAGLAARRWLAQGRPVYWVATPQLPGPTEIGLNGQIVARQTISLPEKLVTRDQRPGADGLFRQELEIWQLRSEG